MGRASITVHWGACSTQNCCPHACREMTFLSWVGEGGEGAIAHLLRVPPSFAVSEAVCSHVTRPAVKLDSLRAQLPLLWQRSSASGGGKCRRSRCTPRCTCRPCHAH